MYINILRTSGYDEGKQDAHIYTKKYLCKNM